MSWSPSPYDEGVIGQYENFSSLSPAEQNKILRSQLPSHKALHTAGGTTVRRKYAEKSRAKKKSSVDAESPATPQHYDAAGRGTTPVMAAAEDPSAADELMWTQLESLKELTFSMAQKKEIRRRLLEDQGSAARDGWEGNTRLRWKRFKEDSKEVVRQMQLWRSSIHEIEGRFGNGIRSYFAFLRWLFLLNFYIFILVFFFVCVPTIIFEYSDSSSTVVTTVNSTCAYEPYNPNQVASFAQYLIWWFTGQGFMENTLLFYGYYENTITGLTNSSFIYNIPIAYILTTFAYFILSLALLVKRATTGLKESLVSGENRFYTYCNKVFSGWDFCITDENAATLKHSSLKYELETDLEEERIRRRQSNRTTKEKVWLYTKRVLINFIVLLVLAGSMTGIYFAAEFALKNTDTYDTDFFLDLLVTYMVSIVITVANFISPLLFGVLIPFEDYSPAFAIKFTLIRTVILRLVSVMFLYVVVYLQINCQSYDIVDVEYNANCSYCEGMPCWETYMGQEMYKLTILDFFVVVGVTLFVEFPRRLIVQHCSCGVAKWVGQQEFAIPSNVLDIVYAQTVMWIGAFYAPLIPVIVVIKFFIIFYLKKLTLIYNCKPATRPYRASRSGAFFFIILLFGYLVAAIPVGVSLALIEPSKDCGPFRGLATMFQAVTDTIATFPSWLASIFWFIGSAGFSVIVGVILSLVLYYYVALSSAHKKMISLLKDQLSLEGRDKQFLLSRVNDLQLRMMGISPENVNYGKKRTANIVNRKSQVNLAYENEDTRSAGSRSLPGQAFE